MAPAGLAAVSDVDVEGLLKRLRIKPVAGRLPRYPARVFLCVPPMLLSWRHLHHAPCADSHLCLRWDVQPEHQDGSASSGCCTA